MRSAVRLWWLLRGRTADADARLPGALATVAFAVATGSLLVVLSGLQAFAVRANSSADAEDALYLTFAVVASGLMVIPILTLGGQAARLTLTRRNARLAALRLAGATTGQSVVIALAETLGQTLLGVLGGIVLYGVTLPVLTLISFRGQPLGLAELWLGWWLLAGAGAVVVLAVASALVTLAGIAITPLGVANRVSPKRLSVLRAVLALGMLIGWPLMFAVLPLVGLIAMALGIVAVINIVGPYVIMLLGIVMSAGARRFPTLLAARRLVDDPRTAWRSCSAFALVIMVACLSSFATLIGSSNGGNPHFGTDIATGATITIVIVSVVAATSAGVVHACRVIDQTPVYRSLAYAGTDLAVLDSSRLREVAWPLAATAATAGAFAALLMVPLGTDAPLALLRFAMALAGSAALTLAALAASRPLLVRAVRLDLDPAAGSEQVPSRLLAAR